MSCPATRPLHVPPGLLASLFSVPLLFGLTVGTAHGQSDQLQIEITKKGMGKEVVITQGTKEWYMLIEVTPENTVVVRQEKDLDKYLVDESETHDRPLAPAEVDGAITDYVNSVKTRAQKK
ncbi:MAG TPA: hypothetical protein VFS39_09860 [Nitrospira sp.]|nr:hypothetical protein [Nitrospira sp.]